MAKKTFISIKCGLSRDPKHRQRMGNRIWLFMHFIDRADFETGTVYDWKDKDGEGDTGIPWRTIQKQRQELEDLGYIKCKLTGRGTNIEIYNWHNPRSYSGEAINPRPNAQADVAAEEYEDFSTQSTHESTQAPNRDLGTPSTQPTKQKSHLQPPAVPAPTPEKPEEAKPKRAPKPKTPEKQAKDAEIEAVLLAFVEVTGIPEPSKKNATYGIRWVNVARDFIARHNGRSVDAMRLAAEKHKASRDRVSGQPLSTKDPGSVMHACPTKEELDAYLAKRNVAQAPRRAPAQIVFEK